MEKFRAKRVTVLFSDQARKTIRSVAGSMDQSVSYFMRDAVKDAVKNELKETNNSNV
ncbi:MAG: hypothetical protein GH151_09395 [Bacteroidetes bacterium]|nr:hypothetical protein [Bacteroidota bacterium]